MRTIASYTTHQFVQTSYGTSLIVNSINQRSDAGRSIHVNGGAATDVIIMDGHGLVTSGTVTQQHRHCSTIIGGILLRHKYIHPTDIKSVTRLFDYGEIPTSDDIDISTVTDNNIEGYRSISTGRGTSSISIGYNMDTAGFTMSHGLNHGIVHTHGHYNDTTTGRLGYYKDTINQYDCMRIRVTIYDGSKDQGTTILIQVLHLRLVRPRMTGE